ncbi:MAG: ABC transporter ATP-binding protein [Oscillospiraceae bacterium]|nr:ABC transporter ATP-binding protein [Oscillospiraceae bacterium]
MSGPVLEVRDLCTSFFQEGGELRAVDGLSYTVDPGACVAIIGESGSGKSVSALSILRLIPYPPGIIKSGSILFQGRDLLRLSNEEMEALRGKEIGMIFQEPATALNPVMTIGDQIAENILVHGGIPDSALTEEEKPRFQGMSQRQRAKARAAELLAKVDIPNAGARLKDYPHQFSGGMQQRAMIAMAMSCKPRLLIADEPTTALDVTVQAQVLEQLNSLRTEFGTALILITHNLGIVARYADQVKIMYGGKLVEEGSTVDVFRNPRHPYTIGLIQAVPRLDLPRSHGLHTIEGEPPDMSKIPPDCCAFHSRCPYADEGCRTRRPVLETVDGEHRCACFHQEAAEAQRKEVLSL